MTLSRKAASLFLPPSSHSLDCRRASASSLFVSPPSTRRAPSPPPPDRKGRLRPGTKAADCFDTDPFSPLPKLSSFSSSFAVQEYIAVLVRRDPHDVELICTIPTSAQDAEEWGAQEREEEEEVELVDEDVWVYEHLRRITLDQHLWLAALTTSPSPGVPPPCTSESCPEMRAESWLFACAAHAVPPDPPCDAPNYMLHCSDGAAALLTSSRYFPSRLSVSEDGRRLLDAVARRLYRSFAHCFFHHPSLFATLESETSLVRRFTELNRRFEMVDPEALIIPELEEGFEGEGGGEQGFEEREEDEEEAEEQEDGQEDGVEGWIREVKRADHEANREEKEA
ncbi:hypothetical protein JCM8547_003918 [Rhodosporidiobolus lusitaniae]